MQAMRTRRRPRARGQVGIAAKKNRRAIVEDTLHDGQAGTVRFHIATPTGNSLEETVQGNHNTNMKNKTSIIVAVCIAALTAPGAVTASAAAKSAASASPKAAASPGASASASAAPTKTARPIPFHGVVSAVDQTAKTFTIAGKTKSRVFKVSDKTEITKGGSAASMSDIAENVEVSGSYWKDAEGSLEAKTVKIGPAAKAKASASASPAESASASPKKP